MRVKGKINTFASIFCLVARFHSLVLLYFKYFYSCVIDATNTHIYGTIRKKTH